MKSSRFCLLIALAFTGCSIVPRAPVPPAMLPRHVAERRVAQDLHTADLAYSQLGTENGRQLYNRAASDLTVVLRAAERGDMWNRPLTFSAGGDSYRLQFTPGTAKGIWSPDTFTSFVPAARVSLKNIRRRNVQTGVGGALVGVRHKHPREPFTFQWGVTGPVTATLDFRGHDATLTLHDPEKQPSAIVAGVTRPLQADFSAPLAYYPGVHDFLVGILAAMHVNNFIGQTGLYMLEPHDPDRIPIIFVHGLISTPQVWRNVINEIEFDPQLRGRFECWVFAYPTGFPVSYSASRLRRELAKGRQLYRWPHGVILVGHSMGGLVAHMQAVTLTSADWIRVLDRPAKNLLARTPASSTLRQMVIFDADPDIKRIVFICTPHRGAEMANGFIGRIGMRLITLPMALAGTLQHVLQGEIGFATGNDRILPNGVTSLSPQNPTLKVMDTVPIHALYHSIIGDRGRGDSPNSSDGVVPYWSSHLVGAQSEKIVPGPHGAVELPETIAELERILHLHLETAGNTARVPARAPAAATASKSN
jgi:pimeloyl-ACP methyl ester carboxylesterase